MAAKGAPRTPPPPPPQPVSVGVRLDLVLRASGVPAGPHTIPISANSTNSHSSALLQLHFLPGRDGVLGPFVSSLSQVLPREGLSLPWPLPHPFAVATAKTHSTAMGMKLGSRAVSFLPPPALHAAAPSSGAGGGGANKLRLASASSTASAAAAAAAHSAYQHYARAAPAPPSSSSSSAGSRRASVMAPVSVSKQSVAPTNNSNSSAGASPIGSPTLGPVAEHTPAVDAESENVADKAKKKKRSLRQRFKEAWEAAAAASSSSLRSYSGGFVAVESNAVASPLVLNAGAHLFGRKKAPKRSMVVAADTCFVLELTKEASRALGTTLQPSPHPLTHSLPTAAFVAQLQLLAEFTATPAAQLTLLHSIPSLSVAVKQALALGVLSKAGESALAASVAAIARPMLLAAGTVLHYEGDYGDCCYLLGRGRVHVSVGDNTGAQWLLLTHEHERMEKAKATAGADGTVVRRSRCLPCVSESCVVFPRPRSTRAVVACVDAGGGGGPAFVLRISHASLWSLLSALPPSLARTMQASVSLRSAKELGRLQTMRELCGASLPFAVLSALTDAFEPHHFVASLSSSSSSHLPSSLPLPKEDGAGRVGVLDRQALLLVGHGHLAPAHSTSSSSASASASAPAAGPGHFVQLLLKDGPGGHLSRPSEESPLQMVVPSPLPTSAASASVTAVASAHHHHHSHSQSHSHSYSHSHHHGGAGTAAATTAPLLSPQLSVFALSRSTLAAFASALGREKAFSSLLLSASSASSASASSGSTAAAAAPAAAK